MPYNRVHSIIFSLFLDLLPWIRLQYFKYTTSLFLTQVKKRQQQKMDFFCDISSLGWHKPTGNRTHPPRKSFLFGGWVRIHLGKGGIPLSKRELSTPSSPTPPSPAKKNFTVWPFEYENIGYQLMKIVSSTINQLLKVLAPFPLP